MRKSNDGLGQKSNFNVIAALNLGFSESFMLYNDVGCKFDSRRLSTRTAHYFKALKQQSSQKTSFTMVALLCNGNFVSLERRMR
jgi:hypothetical protein